jgi:hypothetical protein
LALFSFNIHPEELGAAHALLDKQPHRRAMRFAFDIPYSFFFINLILP